MNYRLENRRDITMPRNLFLSKERIVGRVYRARGENGIITELLRKHDGATDYVCRISVAVCTYRHDTPAGVL